MTGGYSPYGSTFVGLTKDWQTIDVQGIIQSYYSEPEKPIIKNYHSKKIIKSKVIINKPILKQYINRKILKCNRIEV